MQSKAFVAISRRSLMKTAASCRIGLAGVVAGSTLFGAAQAATWDGSTDTDWNTADNWDGGVVPVGDAAIINTDTGNIATITADPIGNPNDVIVGNGSGLSGRLDHTAGTLTTGSWVKIGHNSSTGVYNLADTTGTGGTLTGYAQGSGSLNMTGGELRLGGDGSTGGSGTLNMNTTGGVTVNNGQVKIGQNGTGILNIDSGTFAKTGSGNILVGEGGATGTVHLSGGALTNSGEFQIGNGSGSNGTVTLDGGSISTGSWVSIGRAGGTGVVNVNGGTLTKTGGGSAFIVGDNSTGTLTQTGGLVDAQEGEFWVGSNGGATANYNLSDGTLNTFSWTVIGRDGGTGTMTMTGGTFNKTGAGSDLVVGGDASGTNGTLLFSGGQINTGRDTSVGKVNATGTLTMSGSAVMNTNLLRVGEGAASDTGAGTVSLNGGTLQTTGINGGDRTTGKTVHFNGTLIQAKADSASFITGLNTADIQGGGLVVDTNGFAVESDQAFIGAGDVTKSGSGSLALNGNSTFAGDVLVSAGTLYVNGTLGGTTTTTVDSAAVIGGNGSLAGLVNVNGSVAPGLSVGVLSSTDMTIGVGGVYMAELDGNGVNDRVNIANSLTIDGLIQVFLNYTAANGDSFDLADFSSFGGTPTFDFSNATLDAGLSWDTSGFAATGVITVVPEPRLEMLGLLGVLGLLVKRHRSRG